MCTLKHHELSLLERKNFTILYNEVEKKYQLFNLIKNNENSMKVWIFIVFTLMTTLISVLSNIYEFNYWKSLVNFILGIFALQIVFITSHMKSHALFLEYEKHHVGDETLLNQKPIYYYAFYHHHHSYTDNWATYLSYYDNYNSFVLKHKGTRNITAAHWHGFSILTSQTVFILVLTLFFPEMIYYYFGYEIGVLLLPFAHGWQHLPRKRFGNLKYLFIFLQYIGLIASKIDHDNHHNYKIETVYQDFSSSGIYAKKIDSYLNKLWNKIYKKYQHPYLYYENKATIIYSIILLMFPIIINTI